jgi:hypothetical protein
LFEAILLEELDEQKWDAVCSQMHLLYKNKTKLSLSLLNSYLEST